MRYILPTLLFLISTTPAPMFAEPTKQSGSIELEQYDKVEAPYSQTLKSVIDIFEELQAFTARPQGKDFSSSVGLDENSQILLNALYLYCSVRKGTCVEVLDAILEIDIIESLRTGKAQCPNMKAFWSLWLKNDMEKRHQHQVKTGYLQVTSEFRNKVRPAYVKCEETVTKEIESDAIDNATFFSERYKTGNSISNAITEVLKSLKTAESTNLNLLVATGSGR